MSSQVREKESARRKKTKSTAAVVLLDDLRVIREDTQKLAEETANNVLRNTKSFIKKFIRNK